MYNYTVYYVSPIYGSSIDPDRDRSARELNWSAYQQCKVKLSLPYNSQVA